MNKEYTVAKVSEIPPGNSKTVEVDGEWIAIFNVGGTFYATSDTCSHAQASLAEGSVEDHVVTCPLHGAKFDLKTGKALCMPAVSPIFTYLIKIEGDEIKIVL